MFVSGPVGTSVTGAGLAAIVRSMKSTACSPSGARPAGGSVGPSRPLSPWTCDATVSSRVERPVGPCGDRDVCAADQVEHAERVRGRLLEGLVPVHGRHAQHLELGAREREQQRDRVVVPGVAVEDDRDAHGRSIAIAGSRLDVDPRAATGEDRVDLGRRGQGRLGTEARGGEGTRGAGAGQRLLAVSPFEQRDEEARRERVAGGGAVDDLDRRAVRHGPPPPRPRAGPRLRRRG